MNTTFFVLFLLLVVVASNVISNHLKWLPLPMLYIIGGALLALIPLYRNYLFNPTIFMFLVVTPILYNDAQNASRYWIGRGAINIFSLSIMLVVTTVLVVGGLLHSIFSVLPLALAFALCAIVTPTDASAVSAFSNPNPKFQIPFIILNNESLFNDATGFVAFDLAIGLFLAGAVTIHHALALFLLEFVGGLLLGSFIGWIFHRIRSLLIRSQDDEPLVMMVLELTVPFIVYYLAERLELSGILAVVAAGLVQGVENDNLRFVSSRMQIVRTSVWEIIDNSLTGIIFVLLGISLPTIAYQIGNANHLTLLIAIAISLYVLKFIIRLFWSRYLVWMHIKSQHRWQDSWLMAVSGASGTISLSLAFLIPNQIHPNQWITRNSLIFIVGVTILISLIVAAIVVPILTKPESSSSFKPKHNWRREMIMVAINQLKQQAANHPAEVQVVTDALSQQLHQHRRIAHRKLQQIYRYAYEAEIQAIQELEANHQITADESYYYQEFLTLSLYTLNNNPFKNLWLRLKFGIHVGHLFKSLAETQNTFLTSPIIAEQYYWQRAFEHHHEQIIPLETAGYQAVNQALKKYRHQYHDSVELHEARRYYHQRHRRMALAAPDAKVLYELFLSAFHSEYEFLQQNLQNDKLNINVAQQLQQKIVFDELAYLQNSDAFAPH
ncbi:cation:proton antiporter [Lentilactobacillus kribbianus]|uniref:cation:proton antiporter n=1 Tax=Lentilactobacillus kribbianus TaxID=2729622 RepID=UPI0015523D93|nr:sodium:proton antiporter [Lentilactobacillus kribbianus]